VNTVQGILLFLFIPLVLALFLRQPFGPGLSVMLGLLLMFGHRPVAAPWARRHAGERCAWCGARAGSGERRSDESDEASADGTCRPMPLSVHAGGETWRLVACSEAHRSHVERFLSLLQRWRLPIAGGIFVPLALLLAGSLARAAGFTFLSHDANALQFRVSVALTVVSASVGYLLVLRPDERLRCPFPLHNLLLLGIRQTLWVFRAVGAWWIVDGIRRVIAS
jgi:hypothetical protein